MSEVENLYFRHVQLPRQIGTTLSSHESRPILSPPLELHTRSDQTEVNETDEGLNMASSTDAEAVTESLGKLRWFPTIM